MNKTFRKNFINELVKQFNQIDDWKREDCYNSIKNSDFYICKEQYDILFQYLNTKLINSKPILIIKHRQWDDISFHINIRVIHSQKHQELYKEKYYLKYKFLIKHKKSGMGVNNSGYWDSLAQVASEMSELDVKLKFIQHKFDELLGENPYRRKFVSNVIHDPPDESEDEIEESMNSKADRNNSK